MAISFQCPGCGRSFSVGEEHAGKKAKCRCGYKFTVPNTSSRSEPKDIRIATQKAQSVSASGTVREVKHTYLPWIIGIFVAVGVAASLGVAVGMFVASFEKADLRERISYLEKSEKTLRTKLESSELEKTDLKERISYLEKNEQILRAKHENSKVEKSDLREQVSKLEKSRQKISVPLKTEQITFLPGEKVYEILIHSGSNHLGLPESKVNKSERGFYFYVIECKINTLTWPKEKTEFGGQDWVNIINSTDIVLKTTDGKRIHPSFVSYGMPATLGSEKISFVPGPFRYIALVFHQGTVDGKPTGIMKIFIAQPGPRENLFTVKEAGGVIDPNHREAFPLWFAFSVPANATVKTVGLSDE